MIRGCEACSFNATLHFQSGLIASAGWCRHVVAGCSQGCKLCVYVMLQVVKVIWAYIKEKDLQNPKDRRQILPDAKLGKILKAPVNAFTLNKQLSKHIIKSS